MVELCTTGDGANICGKGQKGQCCIGFKVTDLFAKNPMKTHEFLDPDNVGYFHNAQIPDTCVVQAILLCIETQELLDVDFGPFMDLIDLMKKDLPARGSEPALQPIAHCWCGDMAFLQKQLKQGGGCKNSEPFCTHCACRSNYDLLSFVTGTDRCKIYLHNERSKCNHMVVLEAHEVQKQGTELMKMIIDEDRRMSANPNKTLYDVLPECPVPCVTGVDDKGKAVFSQVDLRDTINKDSSFTQDIQDYLSVMKHREELGAVKDDTIMFCPEAVAKEDNMLNIDFDLEGTNQEAAGEFNMLVLEALG